MPSVPEGIKLVAQNRDARRTHIIKDTLEAGLVLLGSEVKSLRAGACSLKEAYARLEGEEIWLVGCHIPPYASGGYSNHEPLRNRKLLLHKREIRKLAGRIKERGYTLVPLRLYFRKGKAKVELGIATGKRKADRRMEVRERDLKRDAEREWRGRG